MFLRKYPDGNWYVCRTTSSGNRGRLGKSQTYRNWYLIKDHTTGGILKVNGSIVFPKEMIGKKVTFKMEIIDEVK
jgi:hypothetical protein